MSSSLVSAMGEMGAAPSATNWLRLHQALHAARLLVPIRSAGASGEVEFVVGQSEGAPLFVAFTDEDALNFWAEAGHDHVEISAQELCSIVVANDGAGLALNPAGPAGGQLARRDVELVAEGLVPTLDGDLGVMVLPPELAQRAREIGIRIDAAEQEHLGS